MSRLGSTRGVESFISIEDAWAHQLQEPVPIVVRPLDSLGRVLGDGCQPKRGSAETPNHAQNKEVYQVS